MHSPNKARTTADEAAHIKRIKSMPCIVCNAPAPSDAHEPAQGLWWLAIPLCHDGCHQGPHGVHGDKAIWKACKKTPQTCLNEVIRILLTGNEAHEFKSRKKPHTPARHSAPAPLSKIVPRPYI